MSLKDTLRGLRRGNADEPEEDAAGSDVAEPAVFAPRGNGVYEGRDADGAAVGCLRFSGTKVRESTADAPEQSAALGADGQVGDFTPSGRFSTQAPFERAVVYTVLDADEAGFTARRTDTRTGTAAQVRYTFVPSA